MVGSAESIMVDMWYRLKEDDLYRVVFHENPEMTLSAYMAFFSKPSVAAQVLFNTETEELAGMTWLSEFEQLPSHRRATGSFVVLKQFWGRAFTDAIAPVVIPYWFSSFDDGGLNLDVLVGMTPAVNRRAMAFSRKAGLKYLAALPGYTSFSGKPTDAMIAVMTRKDYEERYVVKH